MTKGKTTLIQNNYRPITGLPMVWKIQKAQIGEEIYDSLTNRGLFPEEQKNAASRPEAQESNCSLITHPQREQDETEKSSYGQY